MKKEKVLNFLDKYKWFLLMIVVVLGSFYWFELRPTWARKDCVKKVAEFLKETSGSKGDVTVKYNFLFKTCLDKKGLK